MPTKEEVRQALRQVLDPEIGKPIEDVGMLKDIRSRANGRGARAAHDRRAAR